VEALAGGRWERVAQDLGYRLLLVLEETDGEASVELDRIVAGLASERSPSGVERTIERYEGLAAEYVLPPPEDVFAVGYSLPRSHGRALSQLTDGLRSACPTALDALGEDADRVVAEFAMRDPAVRMPLAHRFARYLPDDEPAASFARFEATLCHVLPRSADTTAFTSAPGRGLRLASDARLVRVLHDVEHEGPAREAPRRRASYLVRADDERDVGIYLVSEGVADAIERAGDAPIEDELEELDALAGEGLLLPVDLES
jgi:hypothetical protein